MALQACGPGTGGTGTGPSVSTSTPPTTIPANPTPIPPPAPAPAPAEPSTSMAPSPMPVEPAAVASPLPPSPAVTPPANNGVGTAAPTPSSTALTYSGSTAPIGASFGGTATTRAGALFGPFPSATSTAVLSLDNQKIDFTKACENFAATGVWQFDAEGKLSALGTYTSVRLLPDDQVDTLKATATLSLIFAAAGTEAESITATVFDATQIALMGPHKLSKTNVFVGGQNGCVRSN